MLRNPELSPDVVKKWLANGLRYKATFNEARKVTVVQWERQDLREFDRNFGRELFLHTAIINPQSDIDHQGYVTQALFEMTWVQEVHEIDGKKWALMKPSYFSLPDPVVYFRTYIGDEEVKLIPHPDF